MFKVSRLSMILATLFAIGAFTTGECLALAQTNELKITPYFSQKVGLGQEPGRGFLGWFTLSQMDGQPFVFARVIEEGPTSYTALISLDGQLSKTQSFKSVEEASWTTTIDGKSRFQFEYCDRDHDNKTVRSLFADGTSLDQRIGECEWDYNRSYELDSKVLEINGQPYRFFRHGTYAFGRQNLKTLSKDYLYSSSKPGSVYKYQFFYESGRPYALVYGLQGQSTVLAKVDLAGPADVAPKTIEVPRSGSSLPEIYSESSRPHAGFLSYEFGETTSDVRGSWLHRIDLSSWTMVTDKLQFNVVYRPMHGLAPYPVYQDKGENFLVVAVNQGSGSGYLYKIKLSGSVLDTSLAFDDDIGTVRPAAGYGDDDYGSPFALKYINGSPHLFFYAAAYDGDLGKRQLKRTSINVRRSNTSTLVQTDFASAFGDEFMIFSDSVSTQLANLSTGATYKLGRPSDHYQLTASGNGLVAVIFEDSGLLTFTKIEQARK